MALRTRTERLAELRRKVLQRLPDAAREEMRRANEKSADDFMATVRRVMPAGDPIAPELISTLDKRPGDPGEVGVIVSIGGPQAPYPLHLEAGHKAPDGSHVPPKPFWNPSKTVVSKRHRGRARRALSKAVKITAGV